MKPLLRTFRIAWRWLPAILLCWPLLAGAQVPVDDDGNPVGNYQAESAFPKTGNEDIPLLSDSELQELVGPIALYPDDLLALVLPAATYPLQVVQAARFLEDLEEDPLLQPDAAWADSIVALVNYPEIVALLNEDLDWTWRLGEAVVAQQADVIAAVETFRDRAYAAGNLNSDSHQTVTHNDGVIEISPVSDDVIYVPYYEPERVVVYHQPRPVYYYYPRPYPVYYYPYPATHTFRHGFFWGVTTAFSMGWYTNSLHVYHHSYYGHPYYGHSYWDRWWYRRPSITVYNNVYVSHHSHRSNDYHHSGDYWRPREKRRTLRPSDQRISRNRHYSRDSDQRFDSLAATEYGTRSSASSAVHHAEAARRMTSQDARQASRPEIRFRPRSSTRRAETIPAQQSRSVTAPGGSSPEDVARSTSADRLRVERQYKHRTERQRPVKPASIRPLRVEAPQRANRVSKEHEARYKVGNVKAQPALARKELSQTVRKAGNPVARQNTSPSKHARAQRRESQPTQKTEASANKRKNSKSEMIARADRRGASNERRRR